MMEKRWNRPNLVVLIRPRNAEQILTYCKSTSQSGAGYSEDSCTRQMNYCYELNVS